MHELFFEVLEQLGQPLNEEERQAIREKFILEEFRRGDFLTEEGEVCGQLGFILDGYARVYVLKDVDEHTVHIAGQGNFIAAFSSFISSRPSFEFVQAITDTQVLTITREDLEALYTLSAKMERMGRMLVEQMFVRKEDRVISFIKYDAKERYNYLMQQYPDMLLDVPLQYIASFLGIKPETLSRIRAQK